MEGQGKGRLNQLIHTANTYTGFFYISPLLLLPPSTYNNIHSTRSCAISLCVDKSRVDGWCVNICTAIFIKLLFLIYFGPLSHLKDMRKNKLSLFKRNPFVLVSSSLPRFVTKSFTHPLRLAPCLSNGNGSHKSNIERAAELLVEIVTLRS